MQNGPALCRTGIHLCHHRHGGIEETGSQPKVRFFIDGKIQNFHVILKYPQKIEPTETCVMQRLMCFFALVFLFDEGLLPRAIHQAGHKDVIDLLLKVLHRE